MSQQQQQQLAPNTKLWQNLALAVDIFMIFLVVLNMSLIAFDGLFEVKLIRENIFFHFFPELSQWYGEEIAPNFLFYEETIFVSIFVLELSVRWIIAIVRRSYSYWFFYPIYHWYDVLGCIPMGSFRILRFLRIFVLLYRLHRWKVIDLNDYALYRLLIHYYNVLVEEVSDRVAINLLEETKSEVKRGEPIGQEIVQSVLKPHRQEIVQWVSGHIQSGLRQHYQNHRPQFQSYLKSILQETVADNKEMSNLERIPIMGPALADSINKAVQGITFGVIDRLSADLANGQNEEVMRYLVDAVVDIIFDLNENSNLRQKQLSNRLVSDSIDLIIERIKEKNGRPTK